MMYFREGEADLDHSVPPAAMIALAAAAVLIVVLGIYPSLIVDLTRGFFRI
jgi:NADH:ubiquinone oxidoreductase subunit 2 (subunit N)